jgi:hypothetical protein
MACSDERVIGMRDNFRSDIWRASEDALLLSSPITHQRHSSDLSGDKLTASCVATSMGNLHISENRYDI